MIQLTSAQQTLLRILGDGHCHTGNELGQALGITRSAIWKQINQLINLGVSINRIAHQGYQLNFVLNLLDEQEINKQLSVHGPLPCKVHLITSVDSTNRYLKELPTSDTLELCCAEIQTQGRGRFGRHWHSPFGENIYCSFRWNLNCDLSRLSGLSLVTSLAVLSCIKEFIPSPDIKIKWPNDLMWHDKKLCGSLIEISAESNAHAQVIIGVGLNVNTDTLKYDLPDKPWCSFYEITQRTFNRNTIISMLAIKLKHYLDKFLESGLGVFLEEWTSADYLAGKNITVTQATGTLSGLANGINQAGQLILIDDQKNTHYLSSGDTTLQSKIK